MPVPVNLNGNPLPWVTSAKYLGNKLTNNQDGYQQDAKEKRARFIGRNVELNQEFYFAHPAVKCRINQIYNSSFSGSMLWNLKGDNTKHLVNSWSVAVRQMWDLPYNTHRKFIETLGGVHCQTMIYSRYVNFIQSIRKCTKLPVIYLLEKVCRDQNTMTGQNIRQVLDLTEKSDIFKINIKCLKKEFKFKELPAEDVWKVEMMKEIVDIKQSVLVLDKSDQNDDIEVDKFATEELNEILEYTATC